ncbi:MAG: DUF3048 domain-containing protein [Clostridia bacterium]|nr:DUF3048 domain-containing protein [Clostridia bacterium]
MKTMKRKLPCLSICLLMLFAAACGTANEAEPSPTPAVTPAPEIVVMDTLPIHSDTWEDILNEEVPPPTEEPSVISATTGRDLPADKRYQPVAVCYDNAAGNRPLSGILEADIVYEASGNGNGTRLLALFNDHFPAEVGPVGSAGADFAEALAEWDAMPVRNEGGAAEFFFSPEEADGQFVDLESLVPALYTEEPAAELHFLLAEGYPYAEAATASRIRLPFEGGAAEYVFDPEAGMYLRYQAAEDGRMAGGQSRSWNGEEGAFENRPLYVQNLIVQYAETGADGFTLVGEGACEFFVRGLHLPGRWSRPSADVPTTYYLEDGSVVTLESGSTWIALLPPESDIELA